MAGAKGVVAARIDPSDSGENHLGCCGCRHDLVLGLRERREAEALEADLTRRRREAEEREPSASERLASEPAQVVAAIRAGAATFRGMRLAVAPSYPVQFAPRLFTVMYGLAEI